MPEITNTVGQSDQVLDLDKREAFITACSRVVLHCSNSQAKAYANDGMDMYGKHEIAVQCLYILNNISHWRGDLAKDCREVFKAIAKTYR